MIEIVVDNENDLVSPLSPRLVYHSSTVQTFRLDFPVFHIYILFGAVRSVQCRWVQQRGREVAYAVHCEEQTDRNCRKLCGVLFLFCVLIGLVIISS